MNSGYRYGFLVLSVVIAGVGGTVEAAEFSAETTIVRLGREQQIKVYVRDDAIREEAVDLFGQRQVLIKGPGHGQTFILYPGSRSYMKIPAIAALSPVGQDEESLKKVGTRRLIGQETVEGYLCDKYEIAFHNTYRGKMLVWVARKLNYPIQMIQTDGPPVGAVDWRLRNIVERPLDLSLFQIPDGYRRIEKPVQGFCGAGVCTVTFY